MKKENLVYIIGLILIVTGTLMNIFHLPYAEFGSIINKIAFGVIFLLWLFRMENLSRELKNLKNKIPRFHINN